MDAAVTERRVVGVVEWVSERDEPIMRRLGGESLIARVISLLARRRVENHRGYAVIEMPDAMHKDLTVEVAASQSEVIRNEYARRGGGDLTHLFGADVRVNDDIADLRIVTVR